MINFQNVSFSYSGEHGTGDGVSGINLTIKDGEFIVLCGESGCGKTTLTRLINGLAPHFYEGDMSGSVMIGDVCVNTENLSDTADPEVFVLDEPSSNLDKRAIQRLHKMLEKIKADGKTVVIAEHRLYYLMDVADRFIYMRSGRRICKKQ